MAVEAGDPETDEADFDDPEVLRLITTERLPMPSRQSYWVPSAA
jgi:hypothetical protein